jgi:dihydroflavonol-4-reductase
MKRVLITGGTGFLGRHLVAHLRQTQPATRLRLLCRASFPTGHDASIEVVRGDVTDPTSVLQAMEGVDEVYHLAGRVSRLSSDRRALVTLHVEGARNVCAAAARCRPEKLVVVSTSGTMAVSRRPTVHDERAAYPYELLNRWPYYLSKLFAEKLILSATAEHGLPTVVVSPSLIVGPDGGPGSTNMLLAPLLERRLPVVPRGGLSLVDVRDVAAALPAAALRGRVGQLYLLTAANVSFRELAGRLAELTGQPARCQRLLPAPLALDIAGLLRLVPAAGPRFPFDAEALEMSAYFWYADASKARDELGFAPRDPSETLIAAVHDIVQSSTRR